jgi:hypothetical protein
VKWNCRFIVCLSSIILFSFAGCKKAIEIPIEIPITPSLTPAPITVAAPGDTLTWVAIASDQSFDVVVDPGLCTQKTPPHASYKNPAFCTIDHQAGGPDKQKSYTYFLKGNVNGTPFKSPPYTIVVGPAHCSHCPMVGPQHCPYCRPPY